MSNEMPSADKYLFEITSFLITSAKRCLGPEHMYGSARLIQTLNLLSHLPEYIPSLKGNRLLTKAREFVEADNRWWDVEKQNKLIEELSSELTKEVKKKLNFLNGV